MRCEICGRVIQGQPHRVIVDTATLLVCSRCSRYGVPAPKLSKAPRVSLSVKPLPASRPSEPQLEVVPDYDVKVKKAREEQGLTQEVLAKLVGEKLSVIKRIEMGKLKPSLDLARKLEKALKVRLVEEAKATEPVQQPRPRLELTLGDVGVSKDRGRKEVE